MNFITKLLIGPFLAAFKKADGWKSIIGYLVAEGAAFLATGNPLAVGAIEKAVAEPTVANILMAVGQALLAIGLIHKGVKNVK